jgi:hypothetical protein
MVYEQRHRPQFRFILRPAKHRVTCFTLWTLLLFSVFITATGKVLESSILRARGQSDCIVEMAPKTGQDIYGFFEPQYINDALPIEKTPARLPSVIREDEASLLKLPPIDADTQIRLITLLPAEDPSEGENGVDPIQCTLQAYSLAQAPEYEALSYT